MDAIDFGDKGDAKSDSEDGAHADGASHFVEAVTCIYDAAITRDQNTLAKALAARMCGEHYTTLRGFGSFIDLIEYYPVFVKDVLDFVAGWAGGLVGKEV